jgi:hypothetical protein
MVMARTADAETQGHFIQKGRFGQGYAACAKIGRYLKPQFILAGQAIIGTQQTAIDAAVMIGHDIAQFDAVGQAVKRYGHARRRTSMRRIKNMRTQGHGKTSVWQDWPHHKKARPIPIMAQRA